MDRRSLPSGATKSSRIRYQLALELAQACPPELGLEIALTGSVSRGLSDDDSDIEWVAWVETLPSAEERVAWLREVGATEIIPDQGFTEQEVVFNWAWCRYQGVWLEAGWQTIAAFEKLLQDILSGRVTTHRPLEVANAIAGALPVRSGGLLARWQQKLTQYPDLLQKRLIAEAVQPWQFAYSYWALARREDRLPLAGRLVEDAERVLRILFALNRRWEPSWKRIESQTRDLGIKPNRLTERINEIFSITNPERSIELCMQLMIDTLELIPPPYDVSRQLASVRERVRARAP